MSSGLSDKKNAPSVTEPLGGAAALGAQIQPKVKPVHIWATVGGAILAFQLYVWIRWITGPNFVRVPAGPSDPPTLMKIVLVTWTTVIVRRPAGRHLLLHHQAVAAGAANHARRHAAGGFGLLFFQDPLLNYFNTWCTYNTWMWNRGSWVQDIPGWVSSGKPGRMMAEPLLMNAPGYSYGVLLCTMLGCWVMRKPSALAEHRNLGLLGVCRVRLLLRPRHRGALPDADGPLHVPRRHPVSVDQCRHLLPVADLRRADVGRRPGRLCSLRYFTDDRGRTFVERGLERVQGGFVRQQSIRFLAIFAASACSSSCSTTFPPSGSRCTPTRGRRTSRSARISRWASAVKGPNDSAPIPPCR